MEPTPSAERWFLHAQGNTLGPLADEQVWHGLESGEFSPADKIYSVRANSWSSLAEHPSFRERIARLHAGSAKNLVPPPPPRFLRKRLPTPPPLVATPASAAPALVPAPASKPVPKLAPAAPAIPAERPRIPSKASPLQASRSQRPALSPVIMAAPVLEAPAKPQKAPAAAVKPAPEKPVIRKGMPLNVKVKLKGALPAKKEKKLAPKLKPAAKEKSVELAPRMLEAAKDAGPTLELEAIEPDQLTGVPLPEQAPALELLPALATAIMAPAKKLAPASMPSALTLEVEREEKAEVAKVASEPASPIPVRPEYEPLCIRTGSAENQANRTFRKPEPVLVKAIRFNWRVPAIPLRGLLAVGIALFLTITTGVLVSQNKTRDLKDSRLPDPSSPTTAPLEAGDPIPPLKAPTRPQRE